MSKKALVGVAAVVVVAAAVLFVASRPSEEPLPQPTPGKVPQLPPAAEDTGTAADLVPADCAYFATLLRGGEVYDLVAESNAVKAVLALPLVEGQLAQLQASPQYQQLMATLDTDPLAQAGLAVAKEAFRQEVFMYGGRDCIAVLANLGELNRLGQVVQFRMGVLSGMDPTAPGANPVPAILAEVLARAEQLYVPPLVMGFRISESREQVVELLEALREMVNARPEVPVEVEKVTVGEGEYYTLQLSAQDLIPPELLGEMRQGLLQAGASGPQVDALVEWLTGQTAAVSVGFFRSYVIVSVGRDNEHLKRLGAGPSVGTCEALTPARRFVQERLVSLGYVSEELAAGLVFKPESLPDLVEGILDGLPAELLPEGLAQRLRADVKELASDVSQALPPPAEQVSVSFLNRGLESYTFTRSDPGTLDCSRPLSILKHAGGDPVLVWGGRAPSSVQAYETLRAWAQRAYGYVEDFLVPTLDPSERQEFDKVETVFLPLVKSLDQTTRETLLPSIDAGQSLLLLDADMRLEQLLLEKPFPRVMPMIEPAFVMELKDSEGLVRAMGEYLQAVDETVMRFREVEGPGAPVEPFRVPRPTSLPFGEGRMYFYQLPMPLDPSIMLHAVVTEDLLILSASPAQSERIVAGDSELSDPVVDIQGLAGAVGRLRTEEFFSAAEDWVDLLLTSEMSPVAMDPESAEFILSQLETAWDFVGTFRGITSRTYQDGPYLISHSWVEFEDVAGEE